MRCIHISSNDINGGAQIASYRIHRSLKKINIDSKIWVRNKFSNDSDVICNKNLISQNIYNFKVKLSSILKRLQKSQLDSFHSNNILPSNLSNYFNRSKFDLINFHWIGQETISIKDISKLKLPKIMTLHDMWAFCGAEHYVDENKNLFWKNGYLKKKLQLNNVYDLNYHTWNSKKKYWKPMDIICPSRWLYDLAKQSKLMSKWNIHHVPYPIDLDVFKKYNKLESRKKNNIPQDSIVILFGAVQATTDKRKGFDLLIKSLNKIKSNKKIIGVVFGSQKSINVENINMKIIYKKHLSDLSDIISLYSCADIMAIPSRQDNLPLIAMEASACSLPIVSFDIGGLPDIVNNGKNGFLTKPFNTEKFANSLSLLIDNVELREKMSLASRKLCSEKFNYKTVANQYLEIYKKVILKN